jgi:GDP-L-fucose synthase
MTSNLQSKIYVAGHRGMVGSAIVRNLEEKGFTNIVTRTHAELELANQAAVKDFFEIEKPDQVYLAAAKVGGIHANNTYPGQFIYENLMIQNNVIHQAFLSGTKKLLFLGSSCIYPKLSPQPMSEDALLSGKLESTNEPYAIAKIAGIKMCESYNRQYGASHGIDYRSVMPTNLYGLGDNYHTENSHVIPALIQRFHKAKITNAPEVTVWGTGTPMREFLFSDDMAAASIFVMLLDKLEYDGQTSPMLSHINIGYGSEISIADLAKLIGQVVKYQGSIKFDDTKPDGPQKKCLDSSLLRKLGWHPIIDLLRGLEMTYEDYCRRCSRNNL